MKPGIGVVSLGCPRNLVDTEALLGRLNFKGYPIVDIDKAQIGIVNTCSFIKEAKEEAIAAILDLVELKKEGRLKKVIVCGCLVERYGRILARKIPEVDAFIGVVSLKEAAQRFALTPRHYAYLKICDGCVNNCSYCIISRLKGKFQSLKMSAVWAQAREFDRQGISELNIIGQDITGYGLDLYGKRRLPELVKGVLSQARNIGWIRLLYLYPGEVVDSLIELIGSQKRICKYIDLPLQHISPRILRLMRRRSSKDQILRLVDKIRKNIPQAAIRTSLIVGFPSETEKEFSGLLKFIERVKFERLGAFVYSREEGTAAYAMRAQVPEAVKRERFDRLMSLQQVISSEVNARLMGKTLEVLIDEEDEPGAAASAAGGNVYLGRSQYDAPEVDGMVYVHSQKKLHPGDFVRVKISDTLEYDLVGTLDGR